MQTTITKCFFALLFTVNWCINSSNAQVIHYSKQNALVNNPDDIQLVPDVAGNYHLLTFTQTEHPRLFIYNADLELVDKKALSFIFQERSQLRIVTFKNYYYICLYLLYKKEYQFWKVDADGNCTDLTMPFRKILQSQAANFKLGFQLIPYQEHLWMVYHTGIENIEKNTVVMLQADSLLNVVFSHKVLYDFKRDEEKLAQEILVFGKYLIILKYQQSASALELMKVNLATGYTIRNSFRSSGYIYSQAGFTYTEVDTSVTVSSLLTEPGFSYTPKQYIFISKLNKILVEQTPFVLLKKQFAKNTSTNFLLVDGYSHWATFKKGRSAARSAVQNNDVAVYEDVTKDNGVDYEAAGVNRMLAKMNAGNGGAYYTDDVGVRFSLLNKELQLTSDTLVPNTKDWYTIKADYFTRFEMDDKECLLVAQQFYNRKNGLLLVHSVNNRKLAHTYLRVNEKNIYLLPKAKNLSGKGIMIPYVRKKEIGVIKIANY